VFKPGIFSSTSYTATTISASLSASAAL